MAPPSPSSTRRGLAARLTAKVGPLPVWAWAAAILGAYLLYTRLHGGSPAAATDTSGNPAEGSASGAITGGSVPASGGGGVGEGLSGDQLVQLYGAGAGQIDALTSALLNSRSLSANAPEQTFDTVPNVGSGIAPGSFTQDGPASATTYPNLPRVTAPAAAAAPVPAAVLPPAGKANNTQTQAGVLKWGGVTFTTKKAFDSWARAHGTTTARELKNYPQARSLYSTLR